MRREATDHFGQPLSQHAQNAPFSPLPLSKLDQTLHKYGAALAPLPNRVLPAVTRRHPTPCIHSVEKEWTQRRPSCCPHAEGTTAGRRDRHRDIHADAGNAFARSSGGGLAGRHLSMITGGEPRRVRRPRGRMSGHAASRATRPSCAQRTGSSMVVELIRLIQNECARLTVRIGDKRSIPAVAVSTRRRVRITGL